MRAYDLAPNPLDLALSRELREGESVLWQGRQIARLTLKSFGIYAFAIPWTAFSLMWTGFASVGAFSMQNETGFLSWGFPLFGLPFILIGLAMLAMPFLPLWWRGRVLFAVTSERVLEMKLGRRLYVKSVPARRIGQIKREEVRDGTGTLKLAISVGMDSDGDKHTEEFKMGEVADVLGAHDCITDIAKRAAQAAKEPVTGPAFSS